MANLISERRDIDFVLYEQLDVLGLTRLSKYQGYNRKTFDLIISEARNFALKELLPIWAEGDRVGVSFENGTVTVPPSFRRAFNMIREGEWTALAQDPQWGGQGLPAVIALAAGEYITGANYCCTSYATFGNGTAKIIELFGSELQKDLFVKKLYTAEWGGTMLLTEPHAGSNVGALSTSAVLNPDGTYTITGNKIFITNGEHDLTENIIHPVLARIEGDPPGSKGLSLFIVPKRWVHEDGTLGDLNDVTCTGIEAKMGSHGSATCSISLGAQGKCRGMLLGKPGQGMMIMFHMMNEARLIVGFQGFIHASAAYLYALAYARERRQGYDVDQTQAAGGEQVPIIRHPDVRRMLLWMKVHVEGMRSLVHYVAWCFDMIAVSEEPDLRASCQGMAELLTPVVKAYCAARGFEVCIQAIQVYGGYGYIRDYPPEQLARDVKIASIYEGTDGIQALDLIGRKLGLAKGAVFQNYIENIRETIRRAGAEESLSSLAAEVKKVLDGLQAGAQHILNTFQSNDRKSALAQAHPFLMAMGDITMAWMLLWRANIAAECLQKEGKQKERIFYQGQIQGADYYIHTVLPETLGRLNAIVSGSRGVVDMAESAFGR